MTYIAESSISSKLNSPLVTDGGLEVWNLGTTFVNPAGHHGAASFRQPILGPWRAIRSSNGGFPSVTFSQDSANADTTVSGQYCLKLDVTATGNTSPFTGLIAEIPPADVAFLKGRAVTLTIRAKSTFYTAVSCQITDSVGSNTSSATIVADGSWQTKTATRTISPSANAALGIQLYVVVEGLAAGTGVAYIDNINLTLTTAAVTFQSPPNAVDSLQSYGVSSLPYGIGRNRVINGEMRIDQKLGGTSFSLTNSNPTTLDMWGGEVSNPGGTVTAQRLTSGPTGFTHYLRHTVTSVDASIVAADRYTFRTDIEGNNVRDFLWGTGDAKTVTFSFWVRSSVTGTYGFGISNSAGNRSYVGQYIISLANTWEQKVITVVGENSGTWLTDSGIGVQIRFDLGCGTNFDGTANAWQAGWFFRASGNTQLISTNGATIDLTGVQLELGSVATSFEYRSFPIELALCQRYYEKSYDLDQAPGTVTGTGTIYIPMAGASTTGIQYATLQFRVHKRTTPTMTAYHDTGTLGSWQVRDNGAVVGIGSVEFTQIGPYNTRIRVNSISPAAITASASSNWYTGFGHWVADARL